MQLHNRKKKVTATTIAFFVDLRSSIAWRCTAAQLHSRKKKARAIAVAFFFLFFLRCTKKKKKKAMAVAIAFFVELRCSAPP